MLYYFKFIQLEYIAESQNIYLIEVLRSQTKHMILPCMCT